MLAFATVVLTQTCPEATRANIKDAFQTALKTTATHTTSHLDSVIDENTVVPGLYKNAKASILVNGEGSTAAQLTPSDALARKVSRSVMIDLKEELPTDAVEQIDEITVALHTKKGVKNGATDFRTERRVVPEQVGYYNYVDVKHEDWDTAPLGPGETRATARLRINTPVRLPSEGPALNTRTAYNRGQGNMYGAEFNDRIATHFPDLIRPTNFGRPFAKDHKFPLIIEITGGTAASDGQFFEQFQISFDISSNRPIPGNPIVVSFIPEYKITGYALDHVKRAVDWILANLPQIDTSKVALFGTSGGGGQVLNYARVYDMSNGVTHGIAMPYNNARNLAESNFSMPVYILSMDGDFVTYSNRVFMFGLKKKQPKNTYATLIKYYDAPPDNLPYRVLHQEFMESFGTFRFKQIWRHSAVANSLHTYDEAKDFWELKQDFYTEESYGELTGVSVSEGGSGYAKDDVLKLSTAGSRCCALFGEGEPATLTVDAVDANGSVTAVKITSPGTFFRDGQFRKTLGKIR